MKRIFTIILSIFIASAVSAQSFEGKITYKNTYKSKTPQLKDEQFDAMMGNKQDYYIKGGDYKSVTNGTFMQWQLYINKDNKVYNKMANSETIYWNDAGTNTDSVLGVQLNKGVVEILGYKCDELILTCKSGTQKFYFNSKLGVDKKLFEKHTYGNWYDYLKKANALPLKYVIDNAQFTMESTAVAVTPMKLDAKEFTLPENAKTEKSPF